MVATSIFYTFYESTLEMVLAYSALPFSQAKRNKKKQTSCIHS